MTWQVSFVLAIVDGLCAPTRAATHPKENYNG